MNNPAPVTPGVTPPPAPLPLLPGSLLPNADTDKKFKFSELKTEEILDSAAKLGQNILRFNVEASLKRRKLYGYMYGVSSASPANLIAEIVCSFQGSIVARFPLVAATGAQSMAQSVNSPFSVGGAQMSNDALFCVIGTPLANEPATIFVNPFEVNGECDEIRVNVLSSVNITAYHIIAGCQSSAN